MSSRLKASLETKIESWMELHCEEDDWSDFWYDTNLHVRMAEAAYAVFQASREAQSFLKEREAEEAAGE